MTKVVRDFLFYEVMSGEKIYYMNNVAQVVGLI